MAKLTCGVSTTSDLVSTINAVEDGSVIANSGLIVSVSGLTIDGFTGTAGDITLFPSGTWFVGFDLFTKEIISLPRLGHSGWVPLAKCVTDATSVVSVETITPLMPECRLPNTVSKIANGEAIKAVIIGSSLSTGTGTTNWSGMLFNSGSSLQDYKVSANATFVNAGLGGAPNMYGLAQTGYFGTHSASDYSDAGYPSGISDRKPMNGNSHLWNDVDLVIVTCLANGGNRRLDCIEPTVRNLRKMGIEVLIVTDNPIGAPFTTYAAIAEADLYVDGPTVREVAERYGCQFADTAAYVADAELRYPDVDIYGDSVHMKAALPNGRVGEPSGGQEVWCRAIRSTIPVDSPAQVTVVDTYTFDTDSEGWETFNPSYCTTYWNASKQRAEKTVSAVSFWGHTITLADHEAGDTISIELTNTCSFIGKIKLYTASGGPPSSSITPVNGTATIELTGVSGGAADTLIIVPAHDGHPLAATMDIDDVTITISPPTEPVSSRINEYQKLVGQLLPKSTITEDFALPAGAFTILPREEARQEGVLSASPNGASSFARRANAGTPVAEDLLTLTTGQAAALAGNGVVSFAMILQSVNGNPDVTYDVYQNNNLQKTVTITAQTLDREIYHPIYTPDELAKSTAIPDNTTLDIRVTAGTLRIAALVCLTSEQSYVKPEEIEYVGAWGDKVGGGSSSLKGYATDTAGDYAVLKCPEDAKRLSWVISSKAVSKPVDIWNGKTLDAGVATVGVSYIKAIGNLEGAGTTNYIEYTKTLIAGGDEINGWGLHIGGAILVHDR